MVNKKILNFTLLRRLSYTSVFLIFIIYLIIYLYIETKVPWKQNILNGLKEINTKGCSIPILDPFDPMIYKFIKEVKPIKCTTTEDWAFIKNGNIILNQRNDAKCAVRHIERLSDHNSILLETYILTEDEPLFPLKKDFVSIHCSSKNDQWQSILAGIARNENAVKRSKEILAKNNLQEPLNILMFGFDSISRVHFIRKLPKAYKYLKTKMNAIILEKYNIVGDGTPQALIPILTGYTELELPDTHKNYKSHFVNVYPFIWKNFSSNGYITAFGEDMPKYGIFTYRLKGFNEQPTDHYMRTYYVHLEEELEKYSKLCVGALPRHKVMLNWLRDLSLAYPDVPTFGFAFHGEISHDDFNLVQIADDDVVEWLMTLQKSGILNKTILILMSDHGNRFGTIRKVQQGKQEERLPFFSFVLPEWFSKKFPNGYQHFVTNAKDRLLTPFDIYETFTSVINYFNHGFDMPRSFNLPLSRGLSIFSNIPQFRSCEEAAIENHWCACLKWNEINNKDPRVFKAANTLVNFINEYNNNKTNLCSTLTLHEITKAEIMIPNKDFLSFKKSSDEDGFQADLSAKTKVNIAFYQIQIIVKPSMAIYEASIKYQTYSDTFSLDESSISRINMYSNQPHCILFKYPNLRKYCYCKIQLPNLKR